VNCDRLSYIRDGTRKLKSKRGKNLGASFTQNVISRKRARSRSGATHRKIGRGNGNTR